MTMIKKPAYGYKCYMLPDSIQIGFALIHLKSLKVKQHVGGIIFMILCVLLLLPIIEWTSIETCIGQNCKLGLSFCSKSLVSSNFKVIVRGGVENIRLQAKDTKKNLRPKTNPLEAKGRVFWGQGQECLRSRTLAQVFSKEKRSSN